MCWVGISSIIVRRIERDGARVLQAVVQYSRHLQSLPAGTEILLREKLRARKLKPIGDLVDEDGSCVQPAPTLFDKPPSSLTSLTPPLDPKT